MSLPEDDGDFVALLHDNGFTWDDANAVNAILSHHGLVVLRAARAEPGLREELADIRVGTTTGMTNDRIARIVRRADYALRALEKGNADDARAALRQAFQRAPVALRAALEAH
jgi:hypothetical protein